MTKRYPENLTREWENEPDACALFEATALLDNEPEVAFKRLKILAESGSGMSMVHLGDAYLIGRRVEQNVDLGVRWLRQAASSGSIEGAYRLACYYESVGNIGDTQKELVKLGDRGFAPAWYALGNIYFRGEGVSKDVHKAIKYWEKAENLGSLVAKQWLIHVLIHDNMGFWHKIKGYMKKVTLFFPIIYYKVQYPDSDRLRNW